MVQVTISGHPGSGTTTLVEALCEHFDWDSLNGGQIFRDQAEKRGLSLAKFGALCSVDFSIDRSLDEILKNKMHEPNGPKIMESRLSGWWAHLEEINCVRIWLEVSDVVRARRVVSREGGSTDDALRANRHRTSLDLTRYEELYGLNPEDKTPYTHIIDASFLETEEVVTAVVKILEESL
jgi:CMP/dCMP kinase